MKKLYTEVLQLDNFLQVLTTEERMIIHQYHTGYRTTVPLVAQTIYKWIQKTHWKPPYFRYNLDRELIWFNDNTKTWETINTHPLYKAKVER